MAIEDRRIRKHIIFHGSVQGVGFRYYSVNKARQLGLAGWVRNLYDGTVEMEVEGREETISQLILNARDISGSIPWMFG